MEQTKSEDKEPDSNSLEDEISDITDKYVKILDKLRVDSCFSMYEVIRCEFSKLGTVFQLAKKIELEENYFVYWSKYIKDLEDKLDFMVRIIESMKRNIKRFEEYDKLI